MPAQGNALGHQQYTIKALKGRHDFLSRPFRALSIFNPVSQGAALGWHGSHRWCFRGVTLAMCMTRSGAATRFLATIRTLLALILLTAVAAAQQLTADDEKALLARLRDQRAEFPALTASFTEERTTRLLNKPVRSTGTIAFHAPAKFRRELTGSSPSLTVCNGAELWIYYPNFSEAEHYTLGKKQFFDDSLAALTAGLNFQDVEKFFRISPAREGTGWRIVLTPKSAGVRRFMTSLTVWLNADALIEKTEATLPKGDRITTVYRNVRPQKSVEAKFDFTPPKGTHISTPLGD